MRALVCLLLCVAAAAAVVAPLTQVSYIGGQPSYLSGPASYIYRVGVQHPYQQPQVYPSPLPLAQPIVKLQQQSYFPVPAPLPYIAHADIDKIDDEEDLEGLNYGVEHGSGNNYNEAHESAKGGHDAEGYNIKNHHEKSEAGDYGKEHEEGLYGDEKGEKSSHHDELDKNGAHHEAGHEAAGDDHGHKKHYSKGEDVTGYHKVFHKDEFKKDHDFYDISDKSGHFNKHEYAKEGHGSEEAAHKKGGKHESEGEEGEYGKEGIEGHGQDTEEDIDYDSQDGNESEYDQDSEYASKESASAEKENKYAIDEEDDDDY